MIEEMLSPGEFEKMRRQGMTYAEVARVVGCSYSTVRRYANRCLPDDLLTTRITRMRQRILELDDGKMTGVALARLVGCSEMYVYTVRRGQRRKRAVAEASQGRDRCGRCSFLDSETNPVWDGMCLWCRLEARGMDLRRFYEAGGRQLGLGELKVLLDG